MKKSDESGSKFRMIDHVSVTKLNYRLYAVILLVAIAAIYLVVAQYFMYSTGSAEEPVRVEILRNSVERFSDGAHPLVIISVNTDQEAVIDVELMSDAYSTRYSSGDYTTNYTASAILPADAFSTQFGVRISASDRKGDRAVRTLSLVTENRPEVMFSVK